MVIRRYYGKQCNALNFLLFVSLRVTYRNSPVLEKQEERERERESFQRSRSVYLANTPVV